MGEQKNHVEPLRILQPHPRPCLPLLPRPLQVSLVCGAWVPGHDFTALLPPCGQCLSVTSKAGLEHCSLWWDGGVADSWCAAAVMNIWKKNNLLVM